MRTSPADLWTAVRTRAGRLWARRREAFTLVEMLMVVAVIAILIGITLKTAVLVNQKTGRARAIRDLSQLKNALAAYYAEYGIYPPSTGSHYMCVDTNLGLGFGNAEGGNRAWTGLAFYVSAVCSPDPAVQKWDHYLKGMISTRRMPNDARGAGGMGATRWTNRWYRIPDPWDRDYIYSCVSPYQTYQLRSFGPNGADENGGGDDIGGSWAE